ncbi:short-chain dehydrogenase [Geopyxis carbonaria]|nr:short-chain dehydrogenase [Geopyxis carbonaria]
MNTYVHGKPATEVVVELAPYIAGKTVLITGVTPSTLGAEAALSIASAHPSILILATRSPTALAATLATLAATHPTVATHGLHLDLSSLASIRAAAASLPADIRIDVLINNAAVMAATFRRTADGLEETLGVCHVGHFALTAALWPRMAPRARVVNVTSAAHKRGDVNWESLDFDGGESYEKWQAYAQAKTANCLFTRGLARRGVLSFAVHPGGVGGTALSRELEAGEIEKVVPAGYQWRTQSEGAAGYVIAGFDPAMEGCNGAYLAEGVVAEMAEWVNDENAERLWRLTEELVGMKFEPESGLAG